MLCNYQKVTKYTTSYTHSGDFIESIHNLTIALVWFAEAPMLLCSVHYKDSQESLEECAMQYCSQDGLCMCVCVGGGGGGGMINVSSNGYYCCYLMTSPGFVLSQQQSKANLDKTPDLPKH